MFVNISPAEYNLEETVTTLVYGTRAKMIVNDSQKNIETRQSLRMNMAFKSMQSQLDSAINALKTNNVPIPSDIVIEEEPEAKFDEEKQDEPANLPANLPEIKQGDTINPEIKQEPSPIVLSPIEIRKQEPIPDQPLPDSPTALKQ